jgi:hypothetical protein
MKTSNCFKWPRSIKGREYFLLRFSQKETFSTFVGYLTALFSGSFETASNVTRDALDTGAGSLGFGDFEKLSWSELADEEIIEDDESDWVYVTK